MHVVHVHVPWSCTCSACTCTCHNVLAPQPSRDSQPYSAEQQLYQYYYALTCTCICACTCRQPILCVPHTKTTKYINCLDAAVAMATNRPRNLSLNPMLNLHSQEKTRKLKATIVTHPTTLRFLIIILVNISVGNGQAVDTQCYSVCRERESVCVLKTARGNLQECNHYDDRQLWL